MKKQITLIFILTIAILLTSTFVQAHDGEHITEEPKSLKEKILTNPIILAVIFLMIAFTLFFFTIKKRNKNR